MAEQDDFIERELEKILDMEKVRRDREMAVKFPARQPDFPVQPDGFKPPPAGPRAQAATERHAEPPPADPGFTIPAAASEGSWLRERPLF